MFGWLFRKDRDLPLARETCTFARPTLETRLDNLGDTFHLGRAAIVSYSGLPAASWNEIQTVFKELLQVNQSSTWLRLFLDSIDHHTANKDRFFAATWSVCKSMIHSSTGIESTEDPNSLAKMAFTVDKKIEEATRGIICYKDDMVNERGLNIAVGLASAVLNAEKIKK